MNPSLEGHLFELDALLRRVDSKLDRLRNAGEVFFQVEKDASPEQPQASVFYAKQFDASMFKYLTIGVLCSQAERVITPTGSVMTLETRIGDTWVRHVSAYFRSTDANAFRALPYLGPFGMSRFCIADNITTFAGIQVYARYW